jgi:hypothetical protein
VQDIAPLRPKINVSDNSEFVAADIKDRAAPDQIGVRKSFPQIRNIMPLASVHRFIPGVENCRRAGIFFFFPKLAYFSSADGVHILIVQLIDSRILQGVSQANSRIPQVFLPLFRHPCFDAQKLFV